MEQIFLPIVIDESIEVRCPGCCSCTSCTTRHEHILLEHRVWYQIPSQATTVQDLMEGIKNEFKLRIPLNAYLDDAFLPPSMSVKIFNMHHGVVRVCPKGECVPPSLNLPITTTGTRMSSTNEIQRSQPTTSDRSNSGGGEVGKSSAGSHSDSNMDDCETINCTVHEQHSSSKESTGVIIDAPPSRWSLCMTDENLEMQVVGSDSEESTTLDFSPQSNTSSGYDASISNVHDETSDSFVGNPVQLDSSKDSIGEKPNNSVVTGILRNKRKLTWTCEELSELGGRSFDHEDFEGNDTDEGEDPKGCLETSYM